jgi:DNA mismatch repair protein MutS
LTRLSEVLPRLQNFAVAVKEWNDEIIFVRQVTPGASERSFGIQVARLAGLPEGVVNRAKEILGSLENGGDQVHDSKDSPTDLSNTKKLKEERVSEKKDQKNTSIARKNEDPSQLELF